MEKQNTIRESVDFIERNLTKRTKPGASGQPGLYFEISFSPDVPADGRGNGRAVYQKAQIGGSGRGT